MCNVYLYTREENQQIYNTLIHNTIERWRQIDKRTQLCINVYRYRPEERDKRFFLYYAIYYVQACVCVCDQKRVHAERQRV